MGSLSEVDRFNAHWDRIIREGDAARQLADSLGIPSILQAQAERLRQEPWVATVDYRHGRLYPSGGIPGGCFDRLYLSEQEQNWIEDPRTEADGVRYKIDGRARPYWTGGGFGELAVCVRSSEQTGLAWVEIMPIVRGEMHDPVMINEPATQFETIGPAITTGLQVIAGVFGYTL